MPAKAGIYDFCLSQQRKPWIPAFAGMTTCAAPVGQSFGYPVSVAFSASFARSAVDLSLP
jgi:hypothetical protein